MSKRRHWESPSGSDSDPAPAIASGGNVAWGSTDDDADSDGYHDLASEGSDESDDDEIDGFGGPHDSDSEDDGDDVPEEPEDPVDAFIGFCRFLLLIRTLTANHFLLSCGMRGRRDCKHVKCTG